MPDTSLYHPTRCLSSAMCSNGFAHGCTELAVCPVTWSSWLDRTALRRQLADTTLQLGYGWVGSSICFKISGLIYGSTSLTAVMQRPRDPGVEMRVALLLSQRTYWRNICFPSTLRSGGLESLVPGGGILPPANTDTAPLNWKIFSLVTWSFVCCLTKR